MLTLKLSKTPRFKKMYRRGYMFEKKTRNIIQVMLDGFKKLKYYVIESRGSRGKADIIVGFYNMISMAEQKRQINSAMKDNGMIMFFAVTDEEKSSNVKFYPSLSEYIRTWTNT